MRFYQPQTTFYCGVDLHTRNMYPTVVSKDGEVLLHRKMPNNPKQFLRILAPYRESVVVSCESTTSWYWLADLCAAEEIEFVLGHALYMRAIHGTKSKNDRIDSEKIARLTAGGLLPQAYAYPREQRSLRDLLRRRLKLVRRRAELFAHVKAVNCQYNLPPLGSELQYVSGRVNVADRFEDPYARRSVEADLELIDNYTPLIRSVEKTVEQAARDVYPQECVILQSIPGVGKIICLTILLEIDQITRFPTRQKFCSYCRLVHPRGESDGKLYGTQGRKQGNPYLKWAFSEAVVCSAAHCLPIKRRLQRLEQKYGLGKGKSILAHKLGRSVYHMLLHKRVFDLEKFLR